MNTAALPVKMYCPFSQIEEDVFFYPVEYEGNWYLDINRFNGCDHNWHACQECETCKNKAYEKAIGKKK